MKKAWPVFTIAAALIIGLCVIVLNFGAGGRPNTAAVLLPDTSGGGSPAGGHENEGTLNRIEVTPKTVQNVLRTLSRADTYSRVVTVETLWSGGGSEEMLECWNLGDSLRIRSGDKNMLISGGELWIWYDDGNGVYHGSADERNSELDRWTRSLTYEDVLELDVSDIKDAGYTDHNGELCIWAEYETGVLGYRSIVYVSVSTGLLMGAETYDGDMQIYGMSSSTPDLTTPGESMFLPP